MSLESLVRPTVIIVDDTEMMRTIIRAVLEKLEFEVVGEAEDGRKGVKLALELEPDLILGADIDKLEVFTF